MKLLLDQNLSFRLLSLLVPAFAGSIHVRDVGLADAGDGTIWAFARSQSFTVVSFDRDFAELAARLGPPPHVVWLRCRNQPSSVIASLLNDHVVQLATFERVGASCFELG